MGPSLRVVERGSTILTHDSSRSLSLGSLLGLVVHVTIRLVDDLLSDDSVGAKIAMSGTDDEVFATIEALTLRPSLPLWGSITS